MKKALLTSALILAAITTSRGDLIGGSSIIASSSLPVFSVGGLTFPIHQIADGITSDAYPFNGFASTANSGIISLDLTSDFDLQGFYLWNDINVWAEGVRTFDLSFYDGNNALIGQTGILNAPFGQLNSQYYDFGTSYAGVSRVDMMVYTCWPSWNHIEIREVAFEGLVTTSAPPPVPEPGTLGLLGLGLLGMAARFKKTRRS